MIRLISVLLFGLLIMSTSVSFANEKNPASETNANAQQTDNFSEQVFDEDDFNFNDVSNYLTEEQLQEAQEINEIDEKSSFSSKIIDSGHFTSETASKTYIPINKVLE